MSFHKTPGNKNYENPVQVEIRKRCEKYPMKRICRDCPLGCKVHDAVGFYYFRCEIKQRRERTHGNVL